MNFVTRYEAVEEKGSCFVKKSSLSSVRAECSYDIGEGSGVG